MELWQLDLVHGFLLADGTSAKALTGVDDHSRYCVSARLMPGSEPSRSDIAADLLDVLDDRESASCSPG